MKEYFTLDDVLIEPKYSRVASRKDVDLSTNLHTDHTKLRLPVVSSNMDTVTGLDMVKVMVDSGGAACLHRFKTIEESITEYKEVAHLNPWVSVGIGPEELNRAKELKNLGASVFVLDVAHGATESVAKSLADLTNELGTDSEFVVGNFATGNSINVFLQAFEYLDGNLSNVKLSFKLGIGNGSACTTRLKTGVGVPQLSAIKEIKTRFPSFKLIADGGCKTPGDVAKCLAAGASMVMLGGMLAGTEESPGKVVALQSGKLVKRYRGSASMESYEVQNKVSPGIRAAEGEAFYVPYKGPAKLILNDIEGGLRSAFSYVGARNLNEFQKNAEFIRVSTNTLLENKAHGKTE